MWRNLCPLAARPRLRAWLAALRGDTPAAQATLAGLIDLRASEEAQETATIALVERFTAADPQPAAALGRARSGLRRWRRLPCAGSGQAGMRRRLAS